MSQTDLSVQSQAALLADRLSRRALRVAGALALWAAALTPAALGWQRCPVARFLHRPCPGCGMSRAAELLLRGHFRESLRMQPAVVPALAALALLMGWSVCAAFYGGSTVRVQRHPLGRVTIALALIAYAWMCIVWVVRAFGGFGGPVAVS